MWWKEKQNLPIPTTLSDLFFLRSFNIVSKDSSKYNSKQIPSEEIDKTLSSNMRNDLNVAETKAESAHIYYMIRPVFSKT